MKGRLSPRVKLVMVGLAFLGFLFIQINRSAKTNSGEGEEMEGFMENALGELAIEFDQDYDGILTKTELAEWFYTVDIRDKAKELQQIWDSCEMNGDSQISQKEYDTFISPIKVGLSGVPLF
eukprot:sb/3475948/